MNTIEQTKLHIMPTYGRNEIVIVNGHGATCYDAEERNILILAAELVQLH